MKKNQTKKQGGFTLIELLIVIGIIAILAAIVLVAVNPARQFSKANDAQRSSNVNAILSAIGQYVVDQKGVLPSDITTTAKSIASGSGNADLCSLLVPTYIPSLPQDPSSNGGAPITNCSSYDTNYTVVKDSNGRITVSAPDTEIGSDISVTR